MGELHESIRIIFKEVSFSGYSGFSSCFLIEIVARLIGSYYPATTLMNRNLKDNPTGVVDTVVRYNNEVVSIPMRKDSKQLWVPLDSFEQHYSVKKTAGFLRVATLGDSSTMGCTDTDDSYPGLMEKMLNQNLSSKYEVLNAGVGSYSSYQGVQRLKHVLLKYKPDIVTVYFGWNDHWITSVPDKDVRIKPASQVALINFLEKFRSYQAYYYIISKVMHVPRAATKDDTNSAEEKKSFDWLKLRVAPDDYMKNMVEFVKMAAENGMHILLVTAPANPSRLSSSSNFPFPKENLIQIHAQYNQIVREVSKRMNVPLLDLEAMIQGDLAVNVLSQDAVHFTPEGCPFIAARFIEKLGQLGWL